MTSILVVDDRASNRDYLVTLLRGSGYTVFEAEDGSAALIKTRATKPDVVIADIVMPVMDGYEFVRHLRADVELASTPVIFLSAHYSQDDAHKLAESCGVFSLITKPAEPEVILAAVSRAMRLASQRAIPLNDHFDRAHLRLVTDKLAVKATELETANLRLRALIELGQRLASEHDPRRLLSDFCHAAGEIAGADYSLVAVRNGAGRLAHVLGNGKDSFTLGRMTSFDSAEKLLHLPLPPGQARLVEAPGDETDQFAAMLPREMATLKSVMVASIATSSRQYGIMCLGDLASAHANGSEQKLAASMGAVIGVSYENAIRYEQIQRHTRQLEDEVAERRRAEEQVQRLNADLERRVTERTLELEDSHRRLRETERMASIGTLSAGLGHDMGNLLLPIRAHLDVLHTKIPDDLSTHVEAIRRCMEYLQSLANGLRLLALSPDDQDATAGETDLGTWQNEVAPLLKSALPRTIALTCDIPHELPAVAIAPHRLTQAVFNLVNNAGEALRDVEGGRIVVLAEQTADRRSIRMAISDNGPGMSAEVRARALEPFFTTKKRAISTGLGLSLVHGIIRSIGGALEIESEVGRGTTISVILPLAPVRTAEESAAAASGPMAAVSLADERMQALVSQILESIGIRIADPGDLRQPEVRFWVTDPLQESLVSARSFAAAGEDRRVVVFGTLDDGWREVGASSIQSKRPSELREELRRIVQSAHGEAVAP